MADLPNRRADRLMLFIAWLVADAIGASTAELWAALDPTLGVPLAGAMVAIPQWLVLQYFVGGMGLWVPLVASAFPVALIAAIAIGVAVASVAQQWILDLLVGLRAVVNTGVLVVSGALVGAILGAAECILLLPRTRQVWVWIGTSAVGSLAYVVGRAAVVYVVGPQANSPGVAILSGGVAGICYGIATGPALTAILRGRRAA
jgi:hypothetical protein